MPKIKKFVKSDDFLSLDEIVAYKNDSEKALKSYYRQLKSGIIEDPDKVGYTKKELEEELGDRLRELELNSIFLLLSSVEGWMRLGLQERLIKKKRKDKINKELLAYMQDNGKEIIKDIPISQVFKMYKMICSSSNILDQIQQAFKSYRHWMAHGRYYRQKINKRYDFDSLYMLIDAIYPCLIGEEKNGREN